MTASSGPNEIIELSSGRDALDIDSSDKSLTL